MRYFMALALIAGVFATGCSRGDEAPREIVVHVKTDPDSKTRGLISATQSLVGMCKTPLDMYELDVGHYPSTEEGLAALRSRPPSEEAKKWDGPYLEKDVALDPWENALRYQCPGKQNPDSYDIWSLGPDGIDGTEEDIGNW